MAVIAPAQSESAPLRSWCRIRPDGGYVYASPDRDSITWPFNCAIASVGARKKKAKKTDGNEKYVKKPAKTKAKKKRKKKSILIMVTRL